MNYALPLALFGALSFSYSTALLAQTTRFDENTGVLQISCVQLYDNGSPAVMDGSPQRFSVSLRMAGDGLITESIQASSPVAGCSGRFDSATGLYTDTGRLGDEAYSIELQLGPDGLFRIASAELTGHAETSLWRVSKDGNELFMAGAVHVLTAADWPLPPVYESAYQLADIVAIEAVPDEGTNLDDILLEYAVRADGGNLSADLTPAAYQRLQLFLLQNNIDILNIELASPGFVSSLIGSLVRQNLGYTRSGVDAAFQTRAKQEGKPVLGLESVASQLEILYDSQGKSAESIIVGALDEAESESTAALLARVVRAWREGDIDSIVREVILPLQQNSPAAYDALITQRNTNWIPPLLEMLQSEEVELVLVGVAHLAGEQSVLSMLEEHGYVVERF